MCLSTRILGWDPPAALPTLRPIHLIHDREPAVDQLHAAPLPLRFFYLHLSRFQRRALASIAIRSTRRLPYSDINKFRRESHGKCYTSEWTCSECHAISGASSQAGTGVSSRQYIEVHDGTCRIKWIDGRYTDHNSLASCKLESCRVSG